MSPALLSDLQNACHPLGVSPLAWIGLLLLGTIGSYLLVKTLLPSHNQNNTRLLSPLQTNTLIVLLPALLLLPAFGLLETHKRKSNLKVLLSFLQTPQKNLLLIEESPTTLEKTYKIQRLPRSHHLELAGKPTPTIETTTLFVIPRPFAQILQAHQSLKKP